MMTAALHPFMPLPAWAFIAPGSGEFLLIMLALILLFGAHDAPRILRRIQDALSTLRRAANDFYLQMLAESVDKPDSEHLDPEITAKSSDQDLGEPS